MHSFITGSYAYGKPTPESDIDLVIYCPNYSDNQLLFQHFGDEKGTRPLRVGKLNIIAVDDPTEWAIWKLGTDILRKRQQDTKKPISSKEAKAFFDTLREPAGRLDNGDSASDSPILKKELTP